MDKDEDKQPPTKDTSLSVQEAVLVKSEAIPAEFSTQVSGYRFERGHVDYHALLRSYRTSGFQATNFGLAVEQISQMVFL